MTEEAKTKKIYRQPEPLAELEKAGLRAAITARFVPEPAHRSEYSLAALDIARNFDALPDIEQDHLGDFIHAAWLRHQGSQEQQQQAQRRYERLDWLGYVVNLRHKGWTLEALAKHTGETLAEVQSIAGVTEAVEAWLQSETQRRQQRDAAEVPETAANSVKAPDALAEYAQTANARYAGTPGLAYLTEFLPGPMDFSDADWLIESINNKTILVCPRCHFLRLSGRPFPLDTVHVKHIEEGTMAPPVDDCDVCTYLPEACRLNLIPCDINKALTTAGKDLAEQRMARAMTLYSLWKESVDAADALLWARMAEAREAVRILPQEVTQKQSEG